MRSRGTAGQSRPILIRGPANAAKAGLAELRVPIFVINLDRSPERLAFMRAQADRIGLKFERVSGIDGARALPQWLSSRFLSETGEIRSRMSSGEVGCYASHLVTFAAMIERKIKAAVVLEDDVTLDADFLRAAQAAIAAAPEGWDCIHLSTRFKNPCFPVADLEGQRKLVRFSRMPAGSAAYAISFEGASKLLAPGLRTRPFDMEFRYAWLADLDIFGVYPAPAVQESALPTTIDATWRTKLRGTRLFWQRRLPKPRWAPSTLSQLTGAIFVKRKLGVIGTLSCWRDECVRLLTRLSPKQV
jgi:glycosyl transferase family 25